MPTALLSLLFACGQPPEAEEAAPLPQLPTSSCGEAYDWQPLTDMGEVLDWEPVEEWSMSAASIRSLLAMGDVPDTGEIQYGSRVYRVRYRTQDRGRPAEATGLIALPDAEGLEPATLLYMHPTTGFEDFCAPSARDIFWGAVPIALAGAGYAVAAPDYLGQNGFGAEAEARHPYLVAEATAVAGLDAVRALWSFSEADISHRGLILGASQGGGGAVWAERYAGAYLPELELQGSVIAVPLLDLVAWSEEGATELSVGSVGAALALASMKDWYGLAADLGEVVVPEQLETVEEVMATECPRTALPEGITSLDQVFTPAWQQAGAEGAQVDWSPWGCVLAENSVGHAPVNQGAGTPVMMVLGGADDVALTASQRIAYRALCDEGHQVIALECAGLGHYDAVLQTMALQLQWLRQLDAGEAMGEPCGEISVVDCAAR
ncbi:MAG: hypothetical protein JXX28_02435 [Deltaproteobacteria bacterium]|nr:hypothetical protein [Deltaproteobacteria bacterium]